ncbi:MAG: hypothetical protein [Bacteriophage sp.]|nr:MAG: hypothetical protein [Bacteriophage sp.]
MEDIIRQVYAQWRVAKEQARQECDSRSLPNMAEKYRMCDMFKGTEDLQSLIRLFTSPQGMEFCIKHRFPNIATFRLFKPFNPEKYGVYIDAGIITLRNPGKAVLIGRTSATINCDTLERHEIFLLHGAKAFINASGWAVVSVKGSTGCQQIRNVSGNAVIL